MQVGVYIYMTMRLAGRVVVAFVTGGLACCYLAYGLSHPPKARAFHYQGVNSFRNITISFVLSNSDNHQDVFPVGPTGTK